MRGRELGVPGLEDVSFRFSKDAIKLLSRDVSPTVRINNQPLVGETPLPDRTWIGTRGRLYNFLTAPLIPGLEPGALTAD